MPWSLLFAIGLVQGIFLIFVFATRESENLLATRLLQALLGWFALSNFDDLLLSTLQIFHFSIYIYLAYRLVQKAKALPAASSLWVPMQGRLGWLYTLMVLFSMILLAIAVLFAWNFSTGYYAAGGVFRRLPGLPTAVRAGQQSAPAGANPIPVRILGCRLRLL